MKHLILLVLGVSLPFCLPAQEVLRLSQTEKTYEVGSQATFWEDVGHNATLEEVLSPEIQAQFQPSEAKRLNFGYNTGSAFWIKFQLRDESSGDIDWLLEIPYPPLDSLTLYTETSIGWKKVQSGEAFPFSARPLDTRTFVFPLDFWEQSTKTFYLRVWTTGSVQVPISVQEKDAFHHTEIRVDTLYGILYGIILIMAFYNLAVGYYLQDYSYLVYGISVLTSFIFLTVLRGHAQQYLWPEYPGLSNPVIGFTTYASFGLYVFFSILFLRTSEKHPIMHRISVGFGSFLLSLALISLFVSYGYTARISALMGILLPFVLMINGIISWRRGYVAARFFVVAWAFYLFGVLILAMVFVGIMPNTFFTMNAAQFGLVAEIILLSLALADRINIYRNENEELVRSQKERLEQKVAERTHELNQKQQEVLAQNEELQQQSEEIRSHRDAIQEQNKVLEDRNRQINASIRAAKVIQEAVLHEPHQHLTTFFADYALIYAPKDVVSGDFYWAHPIENGILVAAVDCTGHGVPGALMSMIGHTLLDKITIEEGIQTPNDVLNQLDTELRKLLPDNVTGNTTGMDLVVLEVTEKQEGNSAKGYRLRLSAAKSPVLLYDQESQRVKRVRGDRVSIGQRKRKKKQVAFHQEEFHLNAGDVIYIGSDGLVDQNNPQRERFGTLRLLELTKKIANQPLIEQEQTIRDTVNAFRKDEPLRDDVLWMGLRLP
mgnify:CR=1 FL=1